MNHPLIECIDLIKIYPGVVKGLNVAALRGITLCINKSDFICIIGPSGSGKSTLIRLLGGIDKPSSGELYFQGTLLNTYSDKQLEKYRHNVGFLYQLPEKNLLPNLSLLQNVILPMLIASKFRGQEKIRAHDLLTKVGLQDKEHRKPNELSGGETQRASIAVALSCNPLILLADEPTGEVDSENTIKLIAYLKQLNQELKTTIVVVSHDKRFIGASNVTYNLIDGKLIYLDKDEIN